MLSAQPRWGILVLGSSLASLISGCGPATSVANPSNEATQVVVARPEVRQITDYEEFTGSTAAVLSVRIQSRVSGYLEARHFVDGQMTHKGDLLYEIDDRPYKAAFDSANASVAAAQAHRDRLAKDYQRARNLFDRAAIGREEFDRIVGESEQAEASLKLAQAYRDNAQLNLDFTRIHSVMDGQLSRTLVDPGNLVIADRTTLTDIVDANKLYVNFDLNEAAIKRLKDLISAGKLDAAAGKTVKIDVGTSDVESFDYQGEVNFSENKLDAATGTLRIRGTIVNDAARTLAPGLFVRVRVPVGQPHESLMITSAAVGKDQGKRFVYVVDSNDEVVYRSVETGGVFGKDLLTITSGLQPNDRVIVEGLQRVRPGKKVNPTLKGSNTPRKTASNERSYLVAG